MKIINKTKNTILAKDAIIADTAFKRMRGLLGKNDFKSGEALILKPGNSIHTFFMRFPIDVLFLDKENRIIKALSSIKPFHFTNIYFKACLTIELPANTIAASSTQEGDILTLE